MYTNYDYEEDLQSEEDRLNQFFGEFSSEIRNKLMSKNLVKPQSLYDIFYPSVKDALLSKNINLFKTDLGETSQKIREQQLAKSVEKTLSLEEQSEDFRKSLLARNDMHKGVNELDTLFDNKRKDLLSKNVSSPTDLIKDSEAARRNNLSKNEGNPNLEKEINKNQESYREKNLSHNVPKKQDLEDNSKSFRSEKLSKNIIKSTNLEKDSQEFRNNELSSNKIKNSDLEKDSENFRNNELSKNPIKESDVNLYSKDFREGELSKNVSKNSNLEKDSESFRRNEMFANVSNDSDLGKDSEAFRNKELSVNVPNNFDLEKASVHFRDSALSNNVTKESSLETRSKDFRNTNLASNNSDAHDIEKESGDYRNKNLSSNVNKTQDVETDSKEFRNKNLSNNIPSTKDLQNDSVSFRNNELAENVPVITDLANDSVPFRNNELSQNIPNTNDLVADSVPFRNNELSLNVPHVTDLSADSVPFRNNELAQNVPIITDLEADSVPFRNNELAQNVPGTTDLAVDSVPFRNNELAHNIPIITDLEADSVPFRNNELAHNIPSNEDLATDSVPFRNNELAHNIPSNEDLAVDSVPFRNSELAHNVPSNEDLAVDSVPFRNSELAHNVPSNEDLATDSVPFRNSELAHNVPSNEDLAVDSIPYLINNLSANVPSSEIIDSHHDEYGQVSSSDDERKHNLLKNVTSLQTLDRHFDQYGNPSGSDAEREGNLSKNVGLGQLGINVLGPGGTSVFVGVSGVWAQGLVFRKMLTMRNKYTTTDYYREGLFSNGTGVDGLLKDTLNVPSRSDILAGKALPINPRETINENVNALYQDKISPIARNLFTAFNSALYQKGPLSYYNIDTSLAGGQPSTHYKIDYNQDENGEKTVGNSLNLSTGDINAPLPPDNINTLIRQYLKYSNPFALNNNGSLKSSNNDTNINVIAAQMNNLTTLKSVHDLIISYQAFDKNRIIRILDSASKSLTAPDGSYFEGDVEKLFDTTYGNTMAGGKSIAAKTAVGNPLNMPNDGFDGDNPRKGVRYILNKIAKTNSDFNINFQDIQGANSGNKKLAKSYVIGWTGTNFKKAYQKYTIKNPYAPEGAGKLVFALTNYAIPVEMGQTMYFPPYIKSFQNNDAANWNAINFLGRPEAVYTYNNSSRDGSISFFILTDYAESVIIGKKQDESMENIVIPITQNFVNQNIASTINEIQTAKDALANKLQAETQKVQDEDCQDDEQNKRIRDYYIQIGQMENEIQNQTNLLLQPKKGYSESSNNNVNVYNDIGISDIENTQSRILGIIDNLKFQPAYFSGSKADFKARMEFLSKLTRPANNTQTKSGFSFTTPPVCHMVLGDWINHDIIIHGVNYDYADAPWTIDSTGEQVQPMWANVTVNFNIVGPAGNSGGVPLTASDKEGFFGTTSIRGTKN